MVPEKIEKLLLKLRKGVTGLTAKQLSDVMSVLDGWSIESMLMLYTFADGWSFDALADAIGAKRPNFHVSPEEGVVVVQSNPRAPVAKVEAVHAAALALAPPPDPPKRGKVYGANVSEMEAVDIEGSSYAEPWTQYRFTLEAWYGTKGFRVTAPDGASIDVMHQPGRGLSLGDLWRWFNDTSFHDDVLGVLGMEPHVPASQRTRKHTGTCSVCTRNIKLTKGRGDLPVMVLHGYRRPGYGHIVGNCPGTGYPPYELSDAGCVAWVGELHTAREKVAASLAALEAGDVEALPSPWGPRGRGAVVHPGEDGWERALSAQIGQARSNLKAIERDIAETELMIERWEPRDPPLSRLALRKILR